ncbi:MAG: type 4a pilus biogenesis protein PilO [bacterium]|nr:type 4a pilus biogenesis protein PilO [bacterium]
MKNANSKMKMSVYYVLPVIAIVVVIGIGLLFVQPKIAEIQDLQQKKAAEEERKSKLDKKLSDLAQLESNKTDILAQQSALTVALPNQKEAPALIIELQKIAQESDIQIQGIQLTPGKLLDDTSQAATGKTGPQITFTLAYKGNYEAIKTFMGKVYKAKRLVNMESVNLNTGGAQAEDGGVSVTSNMAAFYQPRPAIPKDETEAIPILTEDDRKTYDLLQTYNSYQVDGTSLTQPSSEQSATPIPSSNPAASVAPSGTARPTATP